MEGERDDTPHPPRGPSEDSQHSFRADGQNNGRQETIEAAPLLDNWQHPRPQPPGDAAARLTHPLPSLRAAFLLIHRCQGATAAWARGPRHTGSLGPDAHRSKSDGAELTCALRSVAPPGNMWEASPRSSMGSERNEKAEDDGQHFFTESRNDQ